MSAQVKHKLIPRDIRRIAVEADCDPRTVAKAAAGGRVRAAIGEDVRAAAVKLGIRWPDVEPEPREEKAK